MLSLVGVAILGAILGGRQLIPAGSPAAPSPALVGSPPEAGAAPGEGEAPAAALAPVVDTAAAAAEGPARAGSAPASPAADLSVTTPGSAPATATAVAEQRPPPSRLATANLRVVGVDRAQLLDSSGRVVGGPGAVAPGSYALRVWFVPEHPTQVLTLRLSAGETRRVVCHPELTVCE